MKNLTNIKNKILDLPCYQSPKNELTIVSCRLLGNRNQYLNLTIAVPASELTSRKVITSLYSPKIKIYAELQTSEHCKIAKLVSELLNTYSLTCIEFTDAGSVISYLVA